MNRLLLILILTFTFQTLTKADDAIDKIASKKGTTEAGINSLKSNNVLQLFEKGIVNAIKRSKEISNEY